MHIRLSLAALLLAAGFAAAGETAAIQDLTRRNRQLEERVHRLERTALEEDVEAYLKQGADYRGAEGGTALLPGGMGIRFSGQIRVREDISDKAYGPADPAGARSFEFTHMRTRLRADIDVYKDVTATIEFQDVRVFGAEGKTTGMINSVDLKRGILEFKEILEGPVSVELGRLFLTYGDDRIIGHLEWFDQGRSYDGFRVKIRPDGWWLDLMGVRVRDTAPTVDDDRWFFAAYGGRKWIEVYVLFLGDHMATPGETGTGTSDFATIGFRIHRKTNDNHWDYTTEVVFQTGDVNGDDLTAFGFVFNGGYTFVDHAWKPRVGIEVAYASGDDDPTDGDQGGLQTLFPTNHPHYGIADVVGWNNLLDLHARVTVHPRDKVTVTLGYHTFEVIEERGQWVNAGGGVIRSGAPGVDNHLGDEVDLTIVWSPRKGIRFLVQYAIFVPGGFVRDTGNDPTSNVAYIQTSVKF